MTTELSAGAIAPSNPNPVYSPGVRPSGFGALLVDGRAIAERLLQRIRTESSALIASGLRPGLAVVVVGEDPASRVYVKSKGKAARDCGFHSLQHNLPATATQQDLLALIAELNQDAAIHGILVQLPLPKTIDAARVLESIAPEKDVDGFHPVNAGLLALGDRARALVPCTPAGCMVLLQEACDALGRGPAGLEAVVVGRSDIVGKPMVQLLLAADCTVTIAHSKTVDLPAVVRRANVVIAAVGRAEMIRGDWVKSGAIVIDVGINRVRRPDGSTTLTGDVAFSETVGHAGAITPVPGGVGPMTIAMLLANTLEAACRIAGRSPPPIRT